jgi:hypothetical protein
MKLRDRLIHRQSEVFMPKLWAFAYPFSGRGFRRSRRLAFKAWAWAFHVRVRMLDL